MSPRRVAAPGLLAFLAFADLLASPLTAAALILAAAAGMGFQVPNTANLLGYEAEMLEQGVKCGFGEVRLHARKGSRIEEAKATLAAVRASPGVHGAVAVVLLPAAVGRGELLQSVTALGLQAPDGRWPFRLVEGTTLPPGDREGVLLGRALASHLGVGVGGKVALRVVLGRDNLDDELGRYQLTVRGLFAGTFSVCATDSIVLDRSFLAAELRSPEATDLVLVYSDDPAGADALAARLDQTFPNLEARTWAADSELLRSAIHGSAAVAASSTVMVVLAVSLPMAALLYIHSLNRRRRVALLAAIGIGGLDAFLAFLLQALFIGLLGIALGCPIGYGLVRYFQAHPIFEVEQFVLRPVLAARTFAWPALTVLAATLLSGLYPAWRAARIDPADILRRGS